MRSRLTVLTCALAACVGAAALPGAAAAAPVRDRGLNIHATPRHIIAGEGVLIFGRLSGADRAGKVIRLYHRISPRRHFSLIGTTTTNRFGQYEFIRQVGVVRSNRSWFVRGPRSTYSHTVREHVAALVSLSSSAPAGVTGDALTFSGHVTPNHRGAKILLQQLDSAGTGWVTIRRSHVGAGSNYTITHAWKLPGAYDVRVLFGGDARNDPAPSDEIPVIVQQAEVPDFTIASSSPVVPEGQATTISGVLDQPGTTTPEPNARVSLWAHLPGPTASREIMTTKTGSDGSYSFRNVQSTTSVLYKVRTSFAPLRRTAVLFQGVQDVVTMTVRSRTSSVGRHVTFRGTVSPDQSGHVIYLQRRGADSNWHTVEVRRVSPGSTFHFDWTFGTAGMKVFRARVIGGPLNVGGASAPVTMDVIQPPLTSLPTG